ncbi:hypothetical protein NG798_19655 [Ancylothrix sp. C2]|uniref:hypothetical protein n=1 Tax=Ancylothrix sp. D3o TaxID=2953691 RepID=UPI0021BA4B8D|nr:hypothetical protein [Ancylothrix sp. D3o]MCT7952018.1 hypothetical protein [Ancylothrix sp. D3o]
MPSGNASHKSTAIKPNTNMNGAIEETDSTVEIPEITTQASHASRVEEAPENQAATERPNNQ